MKRLLHISILTLTLALLCNSVAWGVTCASLQSKTTWGTAGAVTNITESGTITLSANVKIVGPIAINDGVEVTITTDTTSSGDESSHVISIDSTFKPLTTGDTPVYSMFRVRTGGKLTIKGTGSGNGRIYLDGGAIWVGGDTPTFNDAVATGAYLSETDFTPDDGCIVLEHGLINSFGTLSLNYVNIRDVYNNNTSDSYGGAISIQNSDSAKNGTTTINNTHIYRCVAHEGSAILMAGKDGVVSDPDKVKLTIKNSTIRQCRTIGKNGGTVRTRGAADCALVMTNVDVFCNYSCGHGGGIYWNASGGGAKTKLTLNGCKIYRNTAASSGGGMFIEGSVEFTGSETKISENKAGTAGGGVAINDYNGGQITSSVNLAYDINEYVNLDKNQSNTAGGGLAVTMKDGHKLPKGSTFTVNINGAKITDNKATTSGGGVYINHTPDHTTTNEDGTITYAHRPYVNIGNCTISGNTAGYDGGGFCMQDGYAGTDYELHIDKIGGGTTVISDNKALDGRGGGLYNNKGNITLENLTLTGNSNANLTSRNNVSYHGGGVYQVQGNFTVEGAATITDNSSAERGGGFYVNGGKVTFSSTTKATISGNTAADNGGGFYVLNGDVSLQSADILNNETSMNGGGIAVSRSDNTKTSNVVINGDVKIDGNKATTSGKLGGGGIYVSNGSLEFKGTSTITNNTAADNGGGVYAANSNVTFTGAATLKDNHATSGSGGGVYASGGDVKMLSTATLTTNTAGTSGGGVYAANGDVTIADATFTDNTAKMGGGIYTLGDGTNGDVIITNASFVSNDATSGNGGGAFVNAGDFEIKTKAIFTENTTTANGGGLYVINGNVTIADADINNNTASISGGGIFSEGTGDIIITEALIDQNSSTTLGGGVYVIGGDMSIEQATITNNESKCGGGLYIENGDINITTQATISNNKATATSGGGIYSTGTGDISIADAVIDSNTAVTTGGGIFLSGGALDITKGEISNNSAGTYGGGVHAESDTEVTITLAGAGVFTDNTATNCGGGISVRGLVTLNTSGTIESNTAKNGGGIYLTGGATMNFKDGMICNNKATGTTGTAFTTAYQKTASELYGVGGGVFVEQNSSLIFDMASSTSLGLYGNTATMVADDIFANGNGTTVQIPQVDEMELTGSTMPTTRLFWAEDYMAGDSGYEYGTKIINGWDSMADKYDQVIRYKAAQAILAVRELTFTGDYLTLPRAAADTYPPGLGNYVCLTLGYNNLSVKITRTGLQEGEVAIFTYTRKGDSAPMGRIALRGIDGTTPVSKMVVLSEGEWIIAEQTPWSYNYTVATPSIERTLTAFSTTDDKTFTFEGTKESTTAPHHENSVVNTMK